MKRRITDPATIHRLYVTVKDIERHMDRALDRGDRKSFVVLASHRQMLCDRLRALLDHEIRRP